MAGRVAGKIKLQTVDELLGVPEIAGTQEIEIGRIHAFVKVGSWYIQIPTYLIFGDASLLQNAVNIQF